MRKKKVIAILFFFAGLLPLLYWHWDIVLELSLLFYGGYRWDRLMEEAANNHPEK